MIPKAPHDYKPCWICNELLDLGITPEINTPQICDKCKQAILFVRKFIEKEDNSTKESEFILRKEEL